MLIFISWSFTEAHLNTLNTCMVGFL